MPDKISTDDPSDAGRSRIAKVMARAGVASRRDAEAWIVAGRVSVNGKTISSPALNVGPRDVIAVDGKPLPGRERTRLWLYHKPRGLVTTAKDPEGRTTVFDVLPPELPRVVSVGRLDLNTEGLLLLTNDGGLARVLAHPSTAWLRRYRVRAFGEIEPQQLERLAEGIEVDGFAYGPIEAMLDRQQGDNVWLTLGLREGKNREVRRVLEHLGLKVNRLLRLSFGPFQLGDLGEGAVEEIRTRYLRDQLGGLADEAGCDFDAPLIERPVEPRRAARGRAVEPGAPRRKAALTQDRKGRRVLVERIEKDKTKEPKAVRPRKPREDRPQAGRDERPRRFGEDRPDRFGDGRPRRDDRRGPPRERGRDDRPPRGDRFEGRGADARPGSRAPRRADPDTVSRHEAGARSRPFDKREGERTERPAKRDEPRSYGNRARVFRARPPREERPDRDERRGPPRDRDSRPPRRDGESRPPRRDGEGRPPRRDGAGPRSSGKPGGRPSGPPRGPGKPGGRPSGPPRGGKPGGKPGGGRGGGPRR